MGDSGWGKRNGPKRPIRPSRAARVDVRQGSEAVVEDELNHSDVSFLDEGMPAPRRGSVRTRGAPRVYQVAELSAEIRRTLESSLGRVWVEGEISQLKRSAAGHIYFTLSDERQVAQLNVVLFRGDAMTSRDADSLRVGARIRALGSVTFYAPRGGTQLVAKSVELAGAGDLAAQFEARRKKLEAAGLLDESRKRALPLFPSVIAIVTSRSSAALRDIVRVAKERAPVHLLVAHTSTQGRTAPIEIASAIAQVLRDGRAEVLIVARGGGSAEELFCFNDLRVTRAIANSPIPVVTGVGHETDVTLADLVADRRAATPSNAAELVVPKVTHLEEALSGRLRRLQLTYAAAVDKHRLRLERAALRLRRPTAGVTRQHLTSLERRLELAMHNRIKSAQQALSENQRAAAAQDPRLTLSVDRTRLERATQACLGAMERAFERRSFQWQEVRARLDIRRTLDKRRAEISSAMRHLDALSPLRVLERGYAIALSDGHAVTSSAQVARGDSIQLRLHEGALVAKVTEVMEFTDEPLTDTQTDTSSMPANSSDGKST